MGNNGYSGVESEDWQNLPPLDVSLIWKQRLFMDR